MEFVGSSQCKVDIRRSPLLLYSDGMAGERKKKGKSNSKLVIGTNRISHVIKATEKSSSDFEIPARENFVTMVLPLTFIDRKIKEIKRKQIFAFKNYSHNDF